MRNLVCTAWALSLATLATAHQAAERSADQSWEQWHMKEEHHLDEYDPDLFFTLHDLKSSGFWDRADLLYVYGLSRDDIVGDGSGGGDVDDHVEINQATRDGVVSNLLRLLDADNDGKVSREEFVTFKLKGGELPDLSVGVGHHGDFEAEYENHHWNEYHRDQDPDVHIKHKEDIEHELLHHEHELEETHGKDAGVRELAADFASPVKIGNVPEKFRAQ